MATNNSVNSPLSGTSGTGNFTGNNSPTLTTPKINQINDSNGNPYLAVNAQASAVNWLTVQNAATGDAVVITPAGSDTNIPLTLGAKNASQVRITSELLLYNTIGGNNYTYLAVTATGAQTITLPNATGTIQLQQSSPTIQKFTSGSGTYTTPAGVKYIVVQMCGGGGGGSASSTGTPTAGGAGGNTTFGSSLLTANGGAAPVGGTGAVSGGLGGSFTLNTPAIGQGFNGGDGGAGAYLSGTTGDNAGGSGGSNPFGGSPTGGKTNTAGTAGYANTGAGGSGGGIGATGTATAGAGGGAGGYIYAIINSPSATYSYSVGTGGTAGTGYANGGAGAAGIIIVTEYYQ